MTGGVWSGRTRHNAGSGLPVLIALAGYWLMGWGPIRTTSADSEKGYEPRWAFGISIPLGQTGTIVISIPNNIRLASYRRRRLHGNISHFEHG
jgi:hypothetical protein